MSEEKAFKNRLIREKSSYLQLHAHDPIDWYPWCEEAIKRAEQEDKPIFLSIGYFSCHWCQQMQKEAFSDVEIASTLNEFCINIKVDREEHEEIERLFSRFSQALIGEFVTLPLNIFLTPDLKPFIAKGYLPLSSQFGSIGMQELVEKVKNLWYGEEKEDMKEQADRVVELFEDEQGPPDARGMLTIDDIDANVLTLFQLVDPLYGGLSSLPKSLNPCHLLFMTRFCQARNSARGLFYLNRTLESMVAGGVYDVVGGGFSVYGIERKWCIPHFEKLLSDNALISQVYLQAYFYTEKQLYKEVALKTINFVMEELQNSEQVYYSSIAADLEGREGGFYTWSMNELQELLKDNRFLNYFCRYYDISSGGNFEGENILHAIESLDDFSIKNEENKEHLLVAFNRIIQNLYQSRKKRVKPKLDNKILLSSNALMIQSLILAYRATQNISYLEKAEACSQFIQDKLWEDSQLFKRWVDGERRFEGGLNDYTFLTKALLMLFLDTAKPQYYDWASELVELVEEKFRVEEGAYFLSEPSDFVNAQVDFQDRNQPSGNAIHAENLLTLYQLSSQKKYLERAKGILERVSGYISYQPIYGYYHLNNMLNYFEIEKSHLFIIIYPSHDEEFMALKQKLYLSQKANTLSLWIKGEATELREYFPLLGDCQMKEGKPTLFVFNQGSCVASYEGAIKITTFLQSTI
ncbi:MAG: thioredoxin domain-containing protein [Chlamydiales bacterium]|nr:thioredoxin domain-containing protein [Chlamydiales bacterium]